MKHIKAISCLLLSSMVLTAFCGCDGSREESGVSDAMSGTQSVVSEAISDVSAEESSEEISMESFGEESGVMSCAEESSEEEPSGEESSEEEYSGVELSEYVENISDYTVVTDSSGNCYIEKYNGSDKYITVPSEYDGKPIISVSPFAFEGCDIEGIVFSEGIKEIGIRREPSLDMGGKGVCGSLTVTTVKLPSSLEALGYMMGSRIREITLPAKLRGINQGTFSGCKQLERVEFLGENTGIGEQAFWDCTALSELILPKGLSWLPRGAISGCTSLKSLTLPDAYKGEPMFLPKDITYIVRRGSVAEKTLAAYNAGDWVTTPIKYTVTD